MSKRSAISRLTIIALSLCLSILLPLSKVQAALPHPSGTVSASGFHVNRNLVTPGDWLVYGTYDIPYASVNTTIPAEDAFAIKLLDSTKSIEYGVVTPYSYSEFDLGYNTGNFFLYFGTGPETWSGGYIRIAENPSQFTSPISWDFLIPGSADAGLTTQLDNQLDLAANVLAMARTLQNTYGHTTTEPSAGGTVLTSPYGETYYRGACYGIQAMAPTLFLIQLAQLDVSSTNWTTTQADAYRGRFASTFIGAAENATATQFGIEASMVPAYLITLPLCVGIAILSSLKFKRIEPALVTDAVILIMAFFTGWIPAAVFASVFQLMAIYTGYMWFLRAS